MKCAVTDCPNDSTGGKFVGDICKPCHEYVVQDYIPMSIVANRTTFWMADIRDRRSKHRQEVKRG